MIIVIIIIIIARSSAEPSFVRAVSLRFCGLMFLSVGAKYCTAEIDTSEIVGLQWHVQMDCQWHVPMEFHFCDFWCAICCPASGPFQ